MDVWDLLLGLDKMRMDTSWNTGDADGTFAQHRELGLSEGDLRREY